MRREKANGGQGQRGYSGRQRRGKMKCLQRRRHHSADVGRALYVQPLAALLVSPYRFAPAKIRATGTVGHQSRFWCQRIELQGADRRFSCHQKQGVLSRGSVVQAIAFAGLRSGRAAARATAPAPTGKPTVKPWARAACPSGQPVPDRSAAGFCTGGEWASSNRSNGRAAPGAIDAQ